MNNLCAIAAASFATLLMLFPSFSKAAIRDSFFLESFATIEYSAPKFYGDSSAKHFATDSIFSQIKNFDNIALGFHGRIHKHFGLNFNWSQTDLSTSSLSGYNITKKANLALDYYNLSALFFAPIIEDSVVEAFGELGISSMKSKISVLDTEGVYTKKSINENVPFVGIGLQVAPFESSKDAFRITFQRYLNKLDLVKAHFATIRIGYVKAF